MIFDKGAKMIRWKKDRIYNKWCWFSWWLACRKMQIDPFLQVEQGTLHKTRYYESNRREIGEKPQTYGHRGKFPEQNNNGLCSKIKNVQMGPHIIANLL